VAAIDLFKRSATLSAVRASSIEIYGQAREPPAGATVLFRGVDPGVGPLTKFVIAEPDDNA
jgi:hypothetical protein